MLDTVQVSNGHCPLDRLSLCLTQLTLNGYLIVEFDSFDLDSASFYLDVLLLDTEEDLRPLYNVATFEV